jgi:hypothetical protein
MPLFTWKLFGTLTRHFPLENGITLCLLCGDECVVTDMRTQIISDEQYDLLLLLLYYPVCAKPMCRVRIPKLVASVLNNIYRLEDAIDGSNIHRKPCAGCAMIFPKETEMKRCKNVYYCSIECQQKDWQGHRAECVPPSTGSNAAG